MKSSPLAKRRKPKDLHHDSDVMLFSASPCQTDSKEAGPALNTSHLDFYPPKGQTVFKMDAQRKSRVLTERKLLSVAALVGLKTKQSVTCISALHYFFRPSLISDSQRVKVYQNPGI